MNIQVCEIGPDDDKPKRRREFIVSGMTSPLDAATVDGVPKVLSRQKRFPNWRVCRVNITFARRDACKVTCEYEEAPVAP